MLSFLFFFTVGIILAQYANASNFLLMTNSNGQFICMYLINYKLNHT